MGTGPDNSDRPGDSGSFHIRVPGELGGKAVAALVAMILGGASLKLVTTENIVRPDPWTGSDDRRAMTEFRQEINSKIDERMALAYSYIDQRVSVNDKHRIDAEPWKERIRECESNKRQCMREIKNIESEMRELRGSSR